MNSCCFEREAQFEFHYCFLVSIILKASTAGWKFILKMLPPQLNIYRNVSAHFICTKYSFSRVGAKIPLSIYTRGYRFGKLFPSLSLSLTCRKNGSDNRSSASASYRSPFITARVPRRERREKDRIDRKRSWTYIYRDGDEEDARTRPYYERTHADISWTPELLAYRALFSTRIGQRYILEWIWFFFYYGERINDENEGLIPGWNGWFLLMSLCVNVFCLKKEMKFWSKEESGGLGNRDIYSL